mgnify:CR=1 FL=1
MSQLVPEAAAAEPEGTVKIRIEGLKKSFGDLDVLNGIDTTKIREKWYPLGGRTEAPDYITWPKYDLDGPATAAKRQQPISLTHQAQHLENKAKP